MTDYAPATIQDLVDKGLDRNLTSKARGDAFEDLFCYLLEELPGVRTKRNVIDRFKSCEVDVIVSNRQNGWMNQYPTIFFVECKNWSDPVDAKVVRDFAMKLENRCLQIGVLVAANGITGDPDELNAAHQEIVLQQAKNRRVVVVTLDQLKAVKTTDDFEMLLCDRLMETVGLTRQ